MQKKEKWWCRTRELVPALRRPGFGGQPCSIGGRRHTRRPEEVKAGYSYRRLPERLGWEDSRWPCQHTHFIRSDRT